MNKEFFKLSPLLKQAIWDALMEAYLKRKAASCCNN